MGSWDKYQLVVNLIIPDPEFQKKKEIDLKRYKLNFEQKCRLDYGPQ